MAGHPPSGEERRRQRVGITLVLPIARSKNRRAALPSRRGDKYTSMTCPNWSMARYT